MLGQDGRAFKVGFVLKMIECKKTGYGIMLVQCSGMACVFRMVRSNTVRHRGVMLVECSKDGFTLWMIACKKTGHDMTVVQCSGMACVFRMPEYKSVGCVMSMAECCSVRFVRGMEHGKTGYNVSVQFSGMGCVFRMKSTTVLGV